MQQPEFQEALRLNAPLIERIKMRAHALHDSVCQTYDGVHPYSFHLDMVARFTALYGAEVCQCAADAPAIMFGAYFHDSIEDARLTYRDLLAIAYEYLDLDHALMATEIAYALTNEKGRTRAERANDKYYLGIRTTPYAPLVKLADRLANTAYSFGSSSQHRMQAVYAEEMPHFLASIADPSAADPRLRLPAAMLSAILALVK